MATSQQKKFELIIQMNAKSCPQFWTFSEKVSGVEQLALWRIVEHLAKKQQNLLLNSNSDATEN